MMNWRFVLRGLALGLGFLVVLLAALAIALPRLMPQPPSGPIPPQPTIVAAREDLPAGPAGLQEWARYGDGDYRLAGCGFLLLVPNGDVVGVTAAHSLALGGATYALESVAFRVAGDEELIAEFSALYGIPGQPRILSMDLTNDFVLLRLDQDVDPSLVLEPDPRGAPQPGERVVLYSGLGDDSDRQGVYEGSVLAVDELGAWIVMDEIFEPALMSGSPVVSGHTGQVVGMALAATLRDGRLLMGIHPIGSLVAKAEMASVFPSLVDFRR
jgi:hypothetical protein